MTFGTWPKGTIVTGRPFGSVNRFGAGMTKSLAVPGAGGDCFCSRRWQPRRPAREDQRREPRSAISRSRPHRASFCGRLRGSGLSRRDHVDRAIAGPQILACAVFCTSAGVTLANSVLEPIDARRVVVEERERGEQVGAAEAGELLEARRRAPSASSRARDRASPDRARLCCTRSMTASIAASSLSDGVVASWKNCAIHSIGPL